MDNISTDAAISPPAPIPTDTAQAGRLPAVLLLAGSCMPVLGAVLLALVLPSMTQAFAGTPGVEILVPVVPSPCRR
jgi:hypothetical protein